jgi:hypothetical protein
MKRRSPRFKDQDTEQEAPSQANIGVDYFSRLPDDHLEQIASWLPRWLQMRTRMVSK